MFLGERPTEVVLMRRCALSSSSSPLRCTNGRLKPIPAPLSLDLMRRDKRDEWQSCSITYVHQKNDEMHPESDVEMTSADSTFPCLGRCPASACSSGIDLWYLPKKELAKVKSIWRTYLKFLRSTYVKTCEDVWSHFFVLFLEIPRNVVKLPGKFKFEKTRVVPLSVSIR